MKRKTNNTFTIIELLAVIAIISILATILLPALKKAREEVFKTACKSRLKQIGIATINYINDQNGWGPYHYHNYDGKITWWGKAYEDMGYLKPLTEVLVCPSGEPNRRSQTGNYRWNITYGMWLQKSAAYIKLTPMSVVPDATMDMSSFFCSPSQFLMFGDSVNLDNGTQSFYFDHRGFNHAALELRHRRSANGLFLDGHVETCLPANLQNMGFTDWEY